MQITVSEAVYGQTVAGEAVNGQLTEVEDDRGSKIAGAIALECGAGGELYFFAGVVCCAYRAARGHMRRVFNIASQGVECVWCTPNFYF